MEEIEFEGAILLCEGIECDISQEGFSFANLAPGDTYIGKRNTGWHMSTVSESLWEKTKEKGYVYGDGNIYPYDVGECRKVIGIRD